MNHIPHSNGKLDLAPIPDAEPHQGKEQSRELEFGGRDGPEPTRFGDWEKNGRCIDF